MKYNKILVAIDKTEDAEDVVMSAMLIAEEQAEVHLVTVVEPLTHVYGNLTWAPAIEDLHDLEGSLVKQSKIRLTELALRDGLDIKRTHVVLGSPASNIRRTAEDLDADLIVIGTHGRHGIGLILGSTANSVLHGVNQDVLVVRLASDDKKIA